MSFFKEYTCFQDTPFQCTTHFEPEGAEVELKEEVEAMDKKAIKKAERKWLPGERLLKKLNSKARRKKKAKELDIDRISKSMSAIVGELL
jgi:phage-related protein